MQVFSRERTNEHGKMSWLMANWETFVVFFFPLVLRILENLNKGRGREQSVELQQRK